MTVLTFETGVPKQFLLSSKEVESILMQHLQKAYPQYGNLMPLEKLESAQVFGQTVYVITLESEEDE